MKLKPFACDRCHKRFTTKQATEAHIKDYHRGQGTAFVKPWKQRDTEESMADTIIAGIIDGTWSEDGEYIG